MKPAHFPRPFFILCDTTNARCLVSPGHIFVNRGLNIRSRFLHYFTRSSIFLRHFSLYQTRRRSPKRLITRKYMRVSSRADAFFSLFLSLSLSLQESVRTRAPAAGGAIRGDDSAERGGTGGEQFPAEERARAGGR